MPAERGKAGRHKAEEANMYRLRIVLLAFGVLAGFGGELMCHARHHDGTPHASRFERRVAAVCVDAARAAR